MSLRSNLPLTGVSESKAEKSVIAPISKGFKQCDDTTYPPKNLDCIHREGIENFLFFLNIYVSF